MLRKFLELVRTAIRESMEFIRAALRRVLSLIPIAGSLTVCSRRNMRSALAEVSFTAAFSTAPLWFWPIILLFISGGRSQVANYVNLILESGDLFIWSIAAAGPLLFYVLIERYRSPDPAHRDIKSKFSERIDFPHGNWFVLSSFLVCSISAFFIISSKNAAANGGHEFPLEKESIKVLSPAIFLFILFCLFCASAVKASITEFISRGGYSAGEEDFVNRWRSR